MGSEMCIRDSTYMNSLLLNVSAHLGVVFVKQVLTKISVIQAQCMAISQFYADSNDKNYLTLKLFFI